MHAGVGTSGPQRHADLPDQTFSEGSEIAPEVWRGAAGPRDEGSDPERGERGMRRHAEVVGARGSRLLISTGKVQRNDRVSTPGSIRR